MAGVVCWHHVLELAEGVGIGAHDAGCPYCE